SNDDTGVARLLEFFSKNANVYKDRAFYVLVNIIGEDYRFEKVAHLIGKYKTDFHAKRMQQLFRGSQFCMSQVQGREERGRREDWTLFSGVLTENKVLPWVHIITRGGRYLEGVHMVSHLLSDSILNIIGGNTKGNNLVMTIHERGLLRQTFFANGHLRFSRVSKIIDDSAERVGASIKKELERTLQYLSSMKVSIGGGLTVRVISPSNMVGQLREIIAGSERIKFDFQDVVQVAQKVGLRTPLESLGRDSSLPLQVMFSRLNLSQLAKPGLVIYHRVQLLTKMAVTVFAAWGVTAYWQPLVNFQAGYSNASAISDLSEKSSRMQREYNSEVQSVVGKPPSSPENMRAVSELYSVLESAVVNPTQLLYFVGQGLRKNANVKIKNIEWQVSNSTSVQDDVDAVVVNGQDVYQIVKLEGDLLEVGSSETYRDVAQRADKLIESFKGRDDIYVEVLSTPSKTIATDNLSGSLSSELDVEAPSSREFSLRIIWKEYDADGLAKIANES
ncbi:MAG: hypothetical protein HAW59_00220, partial [Betaproteobacteria bacterium]|nr:hypothetical protein [Betaproteobacteria bacterium]